MCIRDEAGKESVLRIKGVKVVIDRHGGRLVLRRSFVRRVLMYLVSAIVGFVALFVAMMMDSRAYAAGLSEIFMGTFSDVFVGSGNDGKEYSQKDEIAQMPETGDVIDTPRTVVILGSKWKLRPGFQIADISSSDPKVVSVSIRSYWDGYAGNQTDKNDHDGLKGRIAWQAVIRTKKAGSADITLTSVDGETRMYQIFVEDPQVRNLKVVDFVRLGEAEYITGAKYLKPSSAGCSKRKIGQFYQNNDGENVLNIFGSGRTKVTVRYGKYRRTGKIRAKLPRMVSKEVKLSDRPKRIRIKNVPKGWTPVYRSTDPNVAVCSSGGYVAPKGNGTATIYTKIGNTYLICHVTVKDFR